MRGRVSSLSLTGRHCRCGCPQSLWKSIPCPLWYCVPPSPRKRWDNQSDGKNLFPCLLWGHNPSTQPAAPPFFKLAAKPPPPPSEPFEPERRRRLSIRRLYGFRRQRRYKKWRPKGRHTFPAERCYIPPEGGALNPPVRRSRSQAEPWQPRAERPGGWLNLHARKGVSTFGNTAFCRFLTKVHDFRRRRYPLISSLLSQTGAYVIK